MNEIDSTNLESLGKRGRKNVSNGGIAGVPISVSKKAGRKNPKKRKVSHGKT